MNNKIKVFISTLLGVTSMVLSINIIKVLARSEVEYAVKNALQNKTFYHFNL